MFQSKTTHIAMLAVLAMALSASLTGCGAPNDVSDVHFQALSGACTSTGGADDISYCVNACPAGYDPVEKQYCDPAYGTWTTCGCTQPTPPTPDGGPTSNQGHYCSLGGAGGQLGWAYLISPGVYSACYPTNIPRGCAVSAVGVLGATCTNGVGGCTMAGTFACNIPTATLSCNAVPTAPQAETCDGTDQNCNGAIDDGLTCTQTTCFVDADGDGFGTGIGVVVANASVCAAGQATIGGDCNDAVAAINPGATETCNLPGIDDDCDGAVNEGLSCQSKDCYADADGDGYGYGLATTRLGTTCLAGESAVANDCNDANAAVHPGATEICNYPTPVDDNCDGVADGGNTCQSVRCFPDVDLDGFGAGVGVVRLGTTCLAGEVKVGSDCNDANVNIHPGATEICNSFDDNCDGTIDDMLVCLATTCYVDGDMDGFGAGAATIVSNSVLCPSGSSAIFGDCNDGSAAVHPGATETCNTVDDDCSGSVDDGLTCNQTSCYADTDGDGHGAGAAILVTGTAAVPAVCPAGQVGLNDDCNATNASIHPGATESCNLVDDDCDLTVDDGLSCAQISCYADTDGDGYGAGAPTTLMAIACPAGQVTVAGDCANGVATIHPNATEVCGDATDQNCNGIVDDGCIVTNCFIDADGDGFGAGTALAVFGSVCPVGRVASNADCNDASAAQNPVQMEICDGVDNNCNGAINEGLSCVTTMCYTDGDADGYGVGAGFSFGGAVCPAGSSSINGDCNDAVSATHPGAVEACGNGIDDNCNTQVDEACVSTSCYPDTDADGYGAGAVTIVSGAVCPAGQVANNNDCGPSNATVHPGATELCADALDNNCSGIVNEGCATGTTTLAATLSAGHVFVLSGVDTNGFACPAQPIVVDGSINPTAVPGAACVVNAGNTSFNCAGVPTGIPFTVRVCHSFGGTTYVNHTAVMFGGMCVSATAGYADYASITAGNGSPIGGTLASGICRNSPL